MSDASSTRILTMFNRRDFLRSAGAALAVTSLGAGSLPLSAAEKRKLKKAIMIGTVGIKGSVLEQFLAIKAAGFDGVEANSHMKQDEVLKARDETGLAIPSVCCSTHWDKPVSDPDEKVRAAGLEGLKQSLRDAKRYGATSVLFVPAVVKKEVTYAEAYQRSQEEIKKALPMAEELGVKIAIENVWNQFLLSPLEAARYVDEFNSPWVGWHFDVGNIMNYGWPEQWIRILGRRILKVHLKEFSRKRRDDEGLWKGFGVDFLKGDNDWPAVMKALDEIGYQGWVITEQGGADGPAGLKKMVGDVNRILES
jgi:hexulose-6-phosphate isomerase